MAPDDPTVRYLRQRFLEYYRGHDLDLPQRFGRREWAFVFFDRPGMARHIGFATREDLRAFTNSRGPMHLYYSTAYYQKPDAPTMEGKQWLGADLVFDLDADHIEGAQKMSYEQMLDAVKAEFIRLLDDFLIRDFGFAKEHIEIVFSGGRGYHAHVTDPDVLGLGSHERREIVDFIRGTGLLVERLFVQEAVEPAAAAERPFPRPKAEQRMGLAERDAPGWKGRLRRGAERMLDRLESLPPEQAVAELDAIDGIGVSSAREIYDALYAAPPKGLRGVDKIRTSGTLDVFGKNKYQTAFVQYVKDRAGSLQGETDEPVTSDVKRLIRAPGSLHGKSGFRVIQLQFQDLERFDPLREALAFPLDDEVAVEGLKAATVRLADRTYEVTPGPCRLPSAAAVFFMGRRVARPAVPPGHASPDPVAAAP